MKITPDIVGATLKEYKTSITWRQTTNYAAAVGDMNPRYFDDLQERGIIAPPMFAVAVSWPVLENIYDYIQMPYPPEVFRTMVHYSEHIEFHRLMRPGDQVSIKGEVVAVLPHRAGTQIVFKLPVTDPEGKLFHIEYLSALLRGVECSGSGKGAGNIPAVPRVETPPPPAWECDVPIGKEASYIYDGCTNIVFAIHTSPRFARAVGLPGIILQGTATLAYCVREIINREAGGDPAKLKIISGRFTGMVFPGSTIKIQLLKRKEINGTSDLFFQVLNQQGQRAVSKGYARLKK